MGQKVCLLTGSTSGIGEEAALSLAKKGYELHLVARSRERAAETEKKILGEVEGANISWLFGDLSNLDDVRGIAKDFLSSGKSLDLLFLNAGVTYSSRELSADGHEMMFAVNHLAPFLLTNLLLENLCGGDHETRVVMTASLAYSFVKSLHIDDLNSETDFSFFRAYGHSKLSNILFIRLLAQKLLELAPHKNFSINCFHPGFVATNLGTQTLSGKVLMGVLRPFARNSKKGAETGIFLATEPSLTGKNGGYYYNCRQKVVGAHASDDAMAAALWAKSQQLIDG